MLKISELKTYQSTSNSAITRMESAVAKLNGLIERLEADKSRSQSFTLESVKAEREKALPILAAELKNIADIAAQVTPQSQFWESRALLMSLQTFDANAAADAQIKSFWRAEFSTMPAPLLQLSYENAKFDRNLPMLWQAYSTGRTRSNENPAFAQSVSMTLDDVAIPDQAQAMACIAQVKSNQSHAESIAAIASGLRQDPIRKMTVAREQQATARLIEAAA